MGRGKRLAVLVFLAVGTDAAPLAPVPCFSLFVAKVPTHLDTHIRYRSLDGSVSGYVRIERQPGPKQLMERPIRAAQVCGGDAAHRFEVWAWIDTTGETPARCQAPSSDECGPGLEDPTRADVTDAGTDRVVLVLPAGRIVG